MYSSEKAIESSREDFLGRTKFSHELAKSIFSWDEKESLVISICGTWGDGKSSVVNLMKEWFKIHNKEKEVTIFEFNPWVFSGEGDLSKYFFEELAERLFISGTEKDKEIAKKLRLYSKFLDLIPEKSGYSFIKDLFLILGLFGIGLSKFTEFFNVQTGSIFLIKNIAFFVGLFFIVISFYKDLLKKLADYLDGKWKLADKSVLALKKDLQKNLEEREKKLLIIIDDVDRLSQSEIRQIFKLVKINTDFPNTIYILSFDEKVVTCNLEEQKGVSGKEYLNKIVQISFNVPHVKQHKINDFLIDQINLVLSTLPPSHEKYLEEMYWARIYNSGFKNFFKNIRDVKRFTNSLKFNISLMHNEYSMEVNPIDFIAIESIRVFCPEFYFFMKSRNSLFTDIRLERENKGKEEIEEALHKIDKSYQNDLNSLLFVLFPQISNVFGSITIYGHETQSKWGKQLRVCDTSCFDAYFTLIPGGDEEELNQYELDLILKQVNNPKMLENLLKEYIEKNKIRTVLERLQNYTNDENYMDIKSAENIVQVMFNISDLLPKRKGMWDLGSDMDIIRIIYQILKRQKEITKKLEILKNTIIDSEGLAGPVELISLESKSREDTLIPVEKLEEFQLLCVNKIKKFSDEGKLIYNKDFVFILFRWKEWDISKDWETFVEKQISTDDGLIKFVEKFVYEVYSQTLGDYLYITTKEFNYKNLKEFIELETVKNKFQRIKQTNNLQYENKKEIIDIFLNNLK